MRTLFPFRAALQQASVRCKQKVHHGKESPAFYGHAGIGHVIVFVLVFFGSLSAQRLNLNVSYPVLQTANAVWIGAPSGLYRYNQGDDSFIRYTIPSKHANTKVKALFESEEWLWCVLDTGLAGLQIEQNDWLYFDDARGLPSGEVRRLDFEEDAVWAATAGGIARFDLLIEQWESIDAKRGLPDANVIDLKRDASRLWVLLESEIAEYDPRYEKWRRYPFAANEAAGAYRLFQLDDELWAAAENGFLRFNPALQSRTFFSQPYLAKTNVIEAFIEGGTLWIITKQGLFYYEKLSGVWKEFEGNNYLTYANIQFGFVTAGQIWILTKDAVMIWNRQAKNWQTLDYSSGLSSREYNAAFCSGEFAMLFSPQAWDYRKAAGEPWKAVRTGGGEAGINREAILRGLFDNPRGGSFELGGTAVGFQGTRVSLIRDWDRKYSNVMENPLQLAGSVRADAKSQIDFGDSRKILGFYNNIDFSETMYGVRYRGNENDYMRELNWGDFNREPGADPYSESAEMFGVQGWLQYGKKTPRFGRSEFSVKAFSGERESRKVYEHFRGTIENHAVVIRDIDYLKRQFYVLNNFSQPAERWELFSDDKNPASNTPNTRKGEIIAGVPGDYDLLKTPEEWYPYHEKKMLRVIRYISPAANIAARGGAEALLQYAGESSALKNVYSLGGVEIIPSSLELRFYHSNGSEMPLSYFELDKDGDGKPDAECIDYERGLLFFPKDLPFFLTAYGNPPVSSVRIEARFRTEFPMIRLGHTNIARGSEALRLDGSLAQGGNDYIIDYTNGTLTFVREGIVNQDTKIEIEYSYYIQSGNPELSGASAAYSPSDNLLVQGAWQRESGDSIHLFSASGDFRQNVMCFDVRLMPAVAYQSSQSAITSFSLESAVSSPSLRVSAAHKRFEKDYANIYRPQALFGDVRSRSSLSGVSDVFSDVRLSAEWTASEGFRDATGNLPFDRSMNVSALLHNPLLPGWQLTYFSNRAAGGPGNFTGTEKEFVRSDLEYQLPAAFTQPLSLHALRLENSMKAGSGNEQGEGRRFFNAFYRANLSVTAQTQTGISYRREVYDSKQSGKRISAYEKVLADVYFAGFRAVQSSFRMENTLRRHYHPSGNTDNFYLRQFAQANFRVNPGALVSSLSSLFFELNANQSHYRSGIGAPNVWSLSTLRGKDGAFSLGRNYYIRNEYRPSADWVVFSLLEYNTFETAAGAGRMQTDITRLNEKLDYNVNTSTRLVAQYKQTRARSGYGREENTYEPSAWVERRWTQNFSNIFTLLFRRKMTSEGAIGAAAADYAASVDFQYRGYDVFLLRSVELRQSFGGTFRSDSRPGAEDNIQYTFSASLDAFPLHSLIVRLRFDYGAYNELSFDGNDYSTLSFSLKITLQL